MPAVVDDLLVSGDEGQSDEDTLTAPLQRKRGRPSKTSKPRTPIQKKPVVPRGRGRPPKVKVFGRGRPKKLQTTDELEVAENASSGVDEMEDSDNTKSTGAKMSPKGRGRPKK